MKLILLKDVKNVGKAGDTINASDGYAKNFLLPKNLAVEANKSNMNELNIKKRSEEKRKAEELAEAKALAEKLNTKGITIKVKAGENGKLFGSVTGKEIAAELLAQTGIEVDKKRIVLDEPIKETGEKTIPIKIYPGVTAQVKVIVTLD
ncbi:MAG: 50S ribosomal protein L9 [Firmicutes bacterium]|nr:50S ribosomal protein L9 [Bacillota bacterium]